MKTCTKCGETKPLSDFHNGPRFRDGLQPRCKECAKLVSAKWRSDNRERNKETNAKYRASNPEKKKAYDAKWRTSNIDKKKAYDAKWRVDNANKKKEYDSKWRSENRSKVNGYHEKWVAKNPESNRIRCNNRRARKLANGGKLSNGIAEKLFKLQRGKCACGCKQPLGDDYHLDHRMPLALGGSNEDWNMQLLRAKCNHKKHAKHPIDFMQQQGFLL